MISIQKGYLYILSQGVFTAFSAIIVIILSSIGDSENVVKFGIYFSLLAILQSTLSLRFELDIYSDGGKNKDYAVRTAILNCFFISLIISSCIVIAKYYEFDIFKFTLSELMLIVTACALANICMVLKQFYIVRGYSQFIARINVCSILIIFTSFFLIQLIPKYFIFHLFLAAYIFSYSLLIIHWLFTRNSDKKYTFKSYLNEIVRRFDLIKFSTPGLFINLLGQNILILYFGLISNEFELAQLIIIMRIAFLPLSLLSLPLAHLISTEITNNIGHGKPITAFIYRALFIFFISSVLYCLLLFLICSNWLQLIGVDVDYWNTYMPILSILILFRMTISPISNILNILKKEKLMFLLQLFNLLIIVILFISQSQSVVTGLWIFVIGSLSFQLLILLNTLKYSHKNDRFFQS